MRWSIHRQSPELKTGLSPSMAKGRRVERVASLIRREVSELLTNAVHDERVRKGMLTITDVEVSGDLQHCKIFVSIYGRDTNCEEVMDGLSAASSFLRGELGRRLQMRRAPEIIFKLDKGMEKGASVLNILEQLKEARQASNKSVQDDSIN